MQISVRDDIKKVSKELTRIEKKQLPFAIKNALNDVAFSARRPEQNSINNALDRPVKFSTSWLFARNTVTKATKQKLEARLTVPPNRWKYLKYQVQGGTSSRAGKDHAIPINPQHAGKFGHLPKNKVAGLLRKKGYFAARIGGTDGIWLRDKYGGLSLQVLFKPTTRHSASLPLWRGAKRHIEAKFKYRFDKQMANALRTQKF